MKKYISLFLLTLGVFTSPSLSARVQGRVDVAPLYLHIDTIESGKTTQKCDLYGERFDATIVPFECIGLCFKPTYFSGWNGNKHLYQAGLGVGHYTPVNDYFTVIPLVGVSGSRFQTFFDLPALDLKDLKQRFRSTSFYVGGEVIYKFNECLYLTGLYQYAWAHTKTDLDYFGTSKGHSQGSNYGLVLDYYITPKVSISPAFGYTNSLSKEKHGLRGYGAKIGLAYLF